MEPVTHFLTGACIGRAGFNRKTAYATLAAVVAAEAADLDILWGLAGPVETLKHHRGITHTYWAVPVVAAFVVSAVWAIERIRLARTRRAVQNGADVTQSSSSASANTTRATPQEVVKGSVASRTERITIYEADLAPRKKPPIRVAKSRPGQPIHWGWLYLTAFIAALSHILLDWTNNYGVRPLFPLNPRWYEGSFMFIAEPVLWALLFLALFMPWVLGLADREIGARRKPFRGRGWAIFALVGMLVYGCLRWSERAHAQSLLNDTTVASAPITRLALVPYPINPFHWHAILETPTFYQTAEVDTRSDSISTNSANDVMYKPADTPAVEAAKRTLLGQVYLDWGTWAVVSDIGPVPVTGADPPNLPPGRTWTTVEFRDLRFDYAFLPTRSGTRRSPLGAWVYIVDGHQEAAEIMSGREQH